MLYRIFRESRSTLFYVLTLCLLIVLFNGFNFLLWYEFVQNRYYLALYVVALLFFLLYINDKQFKCTYFYGYIKFLFLWPIVPTIISLFYGCEFVTSLISILGWTFASMMFLYYKKFQISEESLMTILTVMGTITAVIQIYQQINPEFAVFGIFNDDMQDLYGELSEIRNGLYRFKVGCAMLQMLCFFYYFDNVTKKITIKNIVFFVLFTVSIYLYLTRQIMVAVGCSCLYLLYYKFKNSKVNTKLLVFVSSVSLFLLGSIYWDNLFGSLIGDYKEDTHTTDIRFDFIQWILNYYLDNFLPCLFGHGPDAFQYALRNRDYHLADIGFLGESYYYGLIWGFVYIGMIYKIFTKCFKAIPLYLKLFFIASTIISIFIFPYTNRPTMVTWVSVLYLSDFYLNKNLKEK